MKKLLALVLALVMTLSLATVSTNAAFEDAADISYEEAADVLSAVGVFVGDGKNFNPKAGLNREQAAKLVAYLALGEDVAEALPAVAMFDDVAASSWAAKYIAYCADAGIITGDGAGKFFPAAPVDGYAFSKMLLCALGYIAEAEGFVGANWQINVAKLAKELNLAKGGVDLSKALTREQAAQVMLNAIKCAPVKYEATGCTVTIGNVVVEKDYGKAEPDGTGVYYEQTWDAESGKVLSIDDGTFDKFGRAAHTWTYGVDEIGTYVDSAADVVITEKLTAKEVAALLKGYKVEWTDGKTYKVDNDTAYTFTAVDATEIDLSDDTVAEAIAVLTDNGKVVELYANDSMVIYDVVMINYTVEEVEDVTTNKKGVSTYKFSVNGTYVDNDDTKLVFAAPVAEEDIVTTVAAGGKLFVYPTTKFVGSVASYNDDNVATIGGKTYEFSKASGSPSTWTVSNDEYTFWLDQYGFVVKSTAVTSSSKNFAYVLDVNASLATGFGGGVPSAQVKVILEDGTVGVYDLKVEKKSGKYYVVDSDAAYMGDYVLATDTRANVQSGVESLVKDKVFTYVISGNTITFKTAAIGAGKTFAVPGPDAMDATQLTDGIYVAKNDTAIKTTYGSSDDAYLNSATTFIFWDSVDEEVEKVIVGNGNLGDYKFMDNAKTQIVVSANDAGTKLTAKYVFVMGGFAAESGAVDEFGFIDNSVYTVGMDSDEDPIRTYTMYLKDGSTLSVVFEGSAGLSNSGLHTYNSDKTVEDDNFADMAGWQVSGVADVADSLVIINSYAYNMTADTLVVDLSDDYDNVDDCTVVAKVKKNSSGAPTNVLEVIYLIDA